jgi:hypothetical protein
VRNSQPIAELEHRERMKPALVKVELELGLGLVPAHKPQSTPFRPTSEALSGREGRGTTMLGLTARPSPTRFPSAYDAAHRRCQ